MNNSNVIQARLSYEENRDRRKPMIYALKQLPYPFIYKDGTVEYRYINGYIPVVSLHEIIGEPRYSNWGADDKASVKFTTFRDSLFCQYVYGKRYILHVYLEDDNDECAKKVAERIFTKRLFPMKNVLK